MPTLGAPLDFAKLEGRNFRGHILGTAPSSPVTGQLYYNTGDNTLYWWDGSAWVSARGGASATPPATTGSLGTVQLAGDLAGTATSPQIAAGAVTDAEVAAANKDGANTTPGMRQLSIGVPGRAMDSMATLDGIASSNQAAANVSLNNRQIVSLADPSSPQHAATKNYVDGVAQGLDVKASVRLATIANIASLSGSAITVDGISVNVGDRILVKDQTATQTNGIYLVASGAWTRTTDLDTWAEVPGAFVFVEQGPTNADTGWVCTADTGGTINSNAMPWTQFAGAGEYIGGAGLTVTGKTFDVGAGTGISVAADTVGIANGGVNTAQIAASAINLNTGAGLVSGTLAISNGGTGNTTSKTARESGLIAAGYYSSATHGAGTTIAITAATHGLRASKGLLIQVQDEASGAVELPDISVAANGDVTVTYAASVAANSKRVTVIG